eukprot:2457253-Pleurochrysis_carterae.AAC.1
MSMGEGWVTDALVRFGGEPVVTNDGDIVYVFPELMITAGKGEPSATRELVGTSEVVGSGELVRLCARAHTPAHAPTFLLARHAYPQS